jgi:PAS domain S-box-containing protein
MESVSTVLKAEVEQAVRDNPDAVVALIDSEGIFRFLSPSVTTVHGYLQSEVVGHAMGEFFENDEARHVGLGLQDALLTGNSVELTRNVRTKSGSYHRMRGGARALLDEDTGETYVLSISHLCD